MQAAMAEVQDGASIGVHAGSQTLKIENIKANFLSLCIVHVRVTTGSQLAAYSL